MELRLATDGEKRARDRLTHEAWGQRLSVDDFVAREERLRAHPWAKEGMRSWLLVDGAQILASCESFEMLSFLDGKAGRTFGVASVYTEAALRGRGHAARMMELLVEAVGPHHAGLLFSDVGDYYARMGWRMLPAFERRLPAERSSEKLSPLVEWLSAGEIDRLWSSVDVPRARFVVWPTMAQLDWQRERERVYAELFGRAPLAHAGARSDGGIVAWAADFKNDKLVVLHLSGRAPLLIAAAQHQAATAGLSQVIVWDVLAGWPDGLGERRTRSDSLPMVLPLAPGAESLSYVPRGLWI
jgi:GNAT superfamily N-acetyltransferase